MKNLKIYLGGYFDERFSVSNTFYDIEKKLESYNITAVVKSGRLYLQGSFIYRSFAIPENSSKFIPFLEKKIESFNANNEKAKEEAMGKYQLNYK
jgi:hypothetical protein